MTGLINGTTAGSGFSQINVTGGTILGAGTVNANTSVGNASGATGTINIGDTGKSGLLAITGTYTQLATGNMTGLINGTTAGSGFSQINVTGTAALAGTISFTVAAAFQSSLTLNETFTVLTASSVTGTFSNSTIAINSSFHFTVSYTATGVVLTVASGPAAAPASAKAAVANPKTLVLTSGLQHRVDGTSKMSKPFVVAALRHSNALPVRGSGWNALRSWERIPVVSVSQARVVVPRVVNESSSRADLPTSDLRMAPSRPMGVPSRLAGWMGTSGNRRVPVKTLSPILPRITR